MLAVCALTACASRPPSYAPRAPAYGYGYGYAGTHHPYPTHRWRRAPHHRTVHHHSTTRSHHAAPPGKLDFDARTRARCDAGDASACRMLQAISP